MLTVRGSGRSDLTAIWEVDEAHPNGEIFLSESSAEAQVGDTTRVRQAIMDGKLVLVAEAPAEAPVEAPASDDGKRGKG